MDAQSNPSSGLNMPFGGILLASVIIFWLVMAALFYAIIIANLTGNSRLLLFWLVMAAFIAIFFLRTPGVCGGGGYVLILL